MLFNSLEFILVFLPITWLGFLLLVKAGRYRGVLAWLTVASLVFYAWWNPPYVLLIVASMLLNYWLGLRLSREAATERFRAGALLAGIVINIGALGYFKYANFFVDNLNIAFNTAFNLERVILPLAISFFTFQQVAYLVDVWKGGARHYTFLEYCFFVVFFPQLIAGPIVQHSEILPQIARDRWRPIRLLNLQVGITIFLIGLFKKMCLADGCAEYATPIFENAASGFRFSTVDAWVGLTAYSLQLYFDFSGYSDMAIGLGRCFGIRLPLNFDSPYKATNIIDFWRRWHITLSRFLRDYVYIPLGGSRRGVVLRYSNLMITMLIGGMWHGAGWNFLIWGGLHGLYLVINHFFNHAAAPVLAARPWVGRVISPFGWALTLLAVMVAWVFFRTADFATATRMLASLFPFQPVNASVFNAKLHMLLADASKFYWLGTVAALALLAPSTHEYLRHYQPAIGYRREKSRGWIPKWRPSLVHGVILGVMVFLTVRRYFQLAPTEFLYFNF
jgi:alginate O-acetyltransferase complex protein AlgI